MGKGKMSKALKGPRKRRAMPAAQVAERVGVPTGAKVNVFTVRTGETIHLETMSQDEAVRHAQGIYNDTGAIPDVEVVEREAMAW